MKRHTFDKFTDNKMDYSNLAQVVNKSYTFFNALIRNY